MKYRATVAVVVVMLLSAVAGTQLLTPGAPADRLLQGGQTAELDSPALPAPGGSQL